MAQVQIRDEHGTSIPRINIRISEGKHTSEQAIFDYDTDSSGNKGWPVPFWPVQDYTLHVNTPPGDIDPRYVSLSVHSPAPATGNWDDIKITLPFVPVPEPPPSTGMFPPEAGRLHMEGDTFRTEDNQPWQWRGFSLFLPYRRFLAGDDIRGDLRRLRAWGVNIIRVFGPLSWNELNGDYTHETFSTARLGEFFQLVGDEGLRIEFVPFCYLWGTAVERRAFAQTCFDIAAAHWNVVFEMVNEPAVGSKPDPKDVLVGVDRHGIPTAYGSYPREGQSFSTVDVLDFGTIHTIRDDAWFRKARHAQEFQASKKKGIVPDEPAKAIEPGNIGDPTLAPHPGFRYTGGKTNPDEFVWYGVISSLWGPGHTLHTEEGKWGCLLVPGTRQHEIVDAVSSQVWAKIDASWQLGSYTGSHLSSSPVDGKDLEIDGKDIWTYSSLHPDKALSVRCATHAPQPKPGWVEVERWGPSGSIVSLKKE